jgi:hypothetical protein
LPEPPDTGSAVSRRLRRQAAWCQELGSPFYGVLLDHVAADFDHGGPVSDVLAGFQDEPGTSALALRFMGAVHRLVLDETLPELAAHYPSAGGDGDAEAAWPVFRRSAAVHGPRIRELVARGCQTNEVGRSAALLGGFLEIAHRSGLELRILELGASAGFNLMWDRYRYESPRGAWGDPASPVRFDHAFEVPPPLNWTATVLERKGCDLNPIDPASEEGALTLRSFVWPDQLSRLALLDGAIEIAAAEPVEVERIGAADFVERELAKPNRGVATVVYHSVFMQYVDQSSQERIAAALQRSKELAGRSAPVHRLSMEPGHDTWEIRLDGELLGTSRAHGTGVRWLVSSVAQ